MPLSEIHWLTVTYSFMTAQLEQRQAAVLIHDGRDVLSSLLFTPASSRLTLTCERLAYFERASQRHGDGIPCAGC